MVLGISELLSALQAADLECFALGPGRLILRPKERVTEEIATAAALWKRELEWLCAHRLPPYPDRPLSEFWLSEDDFLAWEGVKRRAAGSDAPAGDLARFREAS